MARHPRLIVPDVALHIVQRGNNRQDCFRQDNDRLVYLSILRDFSTQRHCALHAYCLMSNHVHLLITPRDERGISLLMRDLGRGYAKYFNRRYERTGTLWEGRFRSCLVDSAAYVLACHRYIELNPVRARMVPHPGAHPWSSYANNVGERKDTLLTAHPEYVALGSHEALRHRAYHELLDTVDDPAFLAVVREATECGYPLVGDRLKAQLDMNGARFERGRPGPRPEPGQNASTYGSALLFE